MNTKSQNQKVLAYMRQGRALTSLDAERKWGIRALNSRIADLGKMGITVDRRYIAVKNRYGQKIRVKQYWLDGPMRRRRV